MEYFIRFIGNKEQAVRDFDRGYSYAAYEVFQTEDEARESDLVQVYGLDEDTIAAMHDMHSGELIGYGFALEGLCGFQVEVDDVDEAIEEARERGGYNGADWPYVAVFMGTYIGEADGGDGDVFRAKELLAVAEL